jgi:hypothetical protein
MRSNHAIDGEPASMSDHTIIAATSASLQALFEAAITHAPEPALNGLMIDLRAPSDAMGLSVWLYRVDTALDRRTVLPTPGQRRPSEAQVFELHYLLTPNTAGPEDEQAVLGRVLETLREHPVLTGDELAVGLTGEIRLSLETLTLDEMTRLWQALGVPYRLAVALLARPLLEAE